METLYKHFKTYEEIINLYCEPQSKLDLSEEIEIAPTTLTALLCFIVNNNVKNIKFNSKLKKLHKDILNNNEISDNVAFVELPIKRSEWFEHERIFDLLNKINMEKYAGFHVLYFVCNELITNVYNHSLLAKDILDKSYIFIQENKDENYLDLCIVDNGMSIPKKFEIAGVPFDDDCEAVYKATQQFSTENATEFGTYVRGIGLWATLKLLIQGNKGNALIVSRRGLLSINDTENYKYELLENNFDGTLVCLRFKNNQVKNFYDLLEFKNDFDLEYSKE